MASDGLRFRAACVLFVLASLAAASASAEMRVLDCWMRPPEPAGLSGLTRVADNRYFAVDDRGGRLYDLTLAMDGNGRIRSFATNRCVRLAGRVDLEGCAWDPLEKRVWVSDENDSSVRQFDPETGVETAVLSLPDVLRREARPNRSLEALAMSPDGLRLYVANEDTLLCDGAAATTNCGGVVRICECVRAGAGRPWSVARQFRYRTHRIRGADWQGRAISGVSALAVEPDGSLLVLEREFSRKALPLPTFHLRLVRVRLPDERVEGELRRKTLMEQDTGFSNYEAMACGPTLPDGTATLVLVSDAGGGAAATILVLDRSRAVKSCGRTACDTLALSNFDTFYISPRPNNTLADEFNCKQ